MTGDAAAIVKHAYFGVKEWSNDFESARNEFYARFKPYVKSLLMF